MPELFPTKTRLALLRDVADGKVRSVGALIWLHLDDGSRAGVSVAVREMKSAGWVKCPGGQDTWEPTDKGRAVLEGEAPT